jgi:hypothetical protein
MKEGFMAIHRTLHQQALHDLLIKKTIEYLKELWYSVEADYPEYKLPPRLGGLKPDIFAKAWWQNKVIVVEVETCDSLDEHAEIEWKTFSEVCQVSGYEFWVVVPEGCLAEAKKKAKEWDIKVNRFLDFPLEFVAKQKGSITTQLR